MTKIPLLVLLLISLTLDLEAWSFQMFENSKPFDNDERPPRMGPWDDEDNPRRINDSCECGIDTNTKRGYKPWQMFVTGKVRGKVFCTGVIITSNLLVTAHDCLQKMDNQFNVFDAWFPGSDLSQNMYTKSSFVISKWSNRPQTDYTIVNVIYNHRYGINLAANNHPTDNLVIFQVTPDFTKDPELGPVCLPEATDNAKDLIGKLAYFYGLGVSAVRSRRSTSWDYVEKCLYPHTIPTTTTTKPSTTTTTTTTPSTTTTTTTEPSTTTTTTTTPSTTTTTTTEPSTTTTTTTTPSTTTTTTTEPSTTTTTTTTPSTPTTTTTTPSTTTTTTTTWPSTTQGSSEEWTTGTPYPPDSNFNPSAPPPPPVDMDTIHGEIMVENVCSQEILNLENQLLCFEKYVKKRIPKWGDGALFVVSGSKGKRHFLVGTAATRPASRDESYDNINFSKVSGLIRYIEHHAARAGSQWCRSDKMELLSSPQADARNAWEAADADLTRDESLDCGCGIKNYVSRRKKRVMGGREANNFEFPWMVLMKTVLATHKAVCAGAIINDRVILTAAECINNANGDDSPIVHLATAKIGVYLRTHKLELDPNKRHAVAHVYYYSDFTNYDRYQNYSTNIALLVLERPLSFAGCNNGLRPICIPTSSDTTNLGGKSAELAGWGIGGYVRPGRPWHPKVLQKGSTTIDQKDVCQRSFPQQYGIHRIRSLCTLRENGAVYSKYDDGAPLMVKQERPLYTKYTHYGLFIYDRLKKTHGEGKESFFVDLRDHLRFIEYYSKKHGARWCRSFRKE